MKLILASTSPYRRELLARLGIPFSVEAPGVDESKVTGTPREIAEKLALEKAKAVAARNPGAVVIGSDQLAAFEGKSLGKPGTVEQAIEQLSLLNGKTHELITAVAVVGKVTRTFTDVTRLTLAHHENTALRRYVEFDKPLDCAGSYKIESRGIALFAKVEGFDPTAIEGLPLMTLAGVLRELGWTIP